MSDYIEREEAQKEIVEWASLLTNPKFLDRDATLDIIRLIPSAGETEITNYCPYCGAHMEEVRKYD